jgi:endo-1,4-beta-mannosidase
MCSIAAAASSLPHIRVAADGHTLETERGKPFVPFGVSYYRPGQGWAPQLWKKFDPEATRKDFARMKKLGVNCVRVFLSYGSFLMETNRLSPEGLAKFDEFLDIAEHEGIYVHPTGPDHWEGGPVWAAGDCFADETVLTALEFFWKEFAGRYRGRSVLYAYDLRNEPEVQWDTPPMRAKWNAWLVKKYPNLAVAGGATNQNPGLGSLPIPPQEDCSNCVRLLDFQHFREEIADEWTRRQVAAIKSADPRALTTIGLIQWSVPSVLPTSWHYSAFRPSRQARYLDFLTIHFYPLAVGHYDYRDGEEAKNLAYLQGVVSEVAACGKPVVVGEFGWHGGGRLTYGKHPAATEEEQARWCGKVVTATAGLACGWLNWGFYDQPEAGDVSQLTGLVKSDGQLKAWGREFKKLSAHYRGKRFSAGRRDSFPALDWDSCITSAAARNKFNEEFFKAWEASKN